MFLNHLRTTVIVAIRFPRHPRVGRMDKFESFLMRLFFPSSRHGTLQGHRPPAKRWGWLIPGVPGPIIPSPSTPVSLELRRRKNILTAATSELGPRQWSPKSSIASTSRRRRQCLVWQFLERPSVGNRRCRSGNRPNLNLSTNPGNGQNLLRDCLFPIECFQNALDFCKRKCNKSGWATKLAGV